MDELGPMFGSHSSGPSLPWLWIIEYLSSFSETGTSIIRGLMEAAPVISDNSGKNASEQVALRCVEELFGPKNGLENVVSSDSRVTFDLSSSCVDVLERIVQEVSLSNLKKARPELLKWNVQPFIMHKRASLPKCALEQLKGSNLEKVPILDGDENGNQKGEGYQDLHVSSRTLEQSNVVGDVELEDDQMENVQNVDADVRVEHNYGDRPCQNVVMDELNYVQNVDANVRVEQKYGDRPCQDVVMNELNYVENGALQKGPSGYAGGNIDQGFPLSSPNSTYANGLQQNIDPDEVQADMEHPCADQICENEDESSFPPAPKLRRKKVPWTIDEEEMLRKGVEKFGNHNSKNVPWKKILDFGTKVFLRDRTAADLKDKWKNMHKGKQR